LIRLVSEAIINSKHLLEHFYNKVTDLEVTDEWRQQPMQYKILPTPPPSLLRHDTVYNEDRGSMTETSFQSDWMTEEFSVLCKPDDLDLLKEEKLTNEKNTLETRLKPDSDRIAANSISVLLSLTVIVGLISYICR
jgi:hypothetical protein